MLKLGVADRRVLLLHLAEDVVQAVASADFVFPGAVGVRGEAVCLESSFGESSDGFRWALVLIRLICLHGYTISYDRLGINTW